jgi:hypothetical protein
MPSIQDCVAQICSYAPPPRTVLQRIFGPVVNKQFRETLKAANWYHFRDSVSPLDFKLYLSSKPHLIINWFYGSQSQNLGLLGALFRDKKEKMYISYGYSGLDCGELCPPRTETSDPAVAAAYYIFRLCHRYKSVEDCVWTICRMPHMKDRAIPMFLIEDCEYAWHRRSISVDCVRNHLVKNPELVDGWLVNDNLHACVFRSDEDPNLYIFYGPGEHIVSSDPFMLVAKKIISLCDLITR